MKTAPVSLQKQSKRQNNDLWPSAAMNRSSMCSQSTQSSSTIAQVHAYVPEPHTNKMLHKAKCQL